MRDPKGAPQPDPTTIYGYENGTYVQVQGTLYNTYEQPIQMQAFEDGAGDDAAKRLDWPRHR